MPTEPDKSDPETGIAGSQPPKNWIGMVLKAIVYMILGTLGLGLLLFGTCWLVIGIGSAIK